MLSERDNYVAWLRYRHGYNDNVQIEVCDSDSEGAFKVYRHPERTQAEPAASGVQRPEWGLKEDGSLGNTMVPKLEMVQEHLAKLASERYDKILELEREKIELSGRIALLEAQHKQMKEAQ